MILVSRKIRNILCLMLVAIQCFFIAIPNANALGNLDFSSSMMIKLINDSSLPIAPGIQERRITLLNSENKRVENFIVEVDLKGNPDVSITGGSYQDGTGYGMSTVRDQIKHAAENGKHVVAGVNADFYNMATGEVLGCFIKDGKIIKDLPGDWCFFGIRKDGTPVLGDYAVYQTNRDQLKDAVGGQCVLVNNGNVIDYALSLDSYYITKQPRTAVGIKSNGAVVFIVSDGRQEPYSAGLTMYDLGKLMKDLGCEYALNLDGGGSSTFVSREQGTDEMACKNKPSDGMERTVANSLLILSNAVSDHSFSSAVIAPFDKTYTPGSTVNFTAKGMDASGASAALPSSGLSWKLSDDSFGAVDPSTGAFVSNGKLGQVQIQLVNESSAVIGSTYVEIAVPDSIFFKQPELSLEFDVLSDLGFAAQYKGRDVILKEGDIIWSIPDGMGTMDVSNIFHTSPSGSVSGNISASLAGTDLTAVLDAKVGQLPVVLYDFENGVGEWLPGSANRGEQISIEAVDYASGEQVRFGDKSLKINFDLTNAQTMTTLGIYAGPGTSKDIPGAPKAIGAWIYATEEAQGYWLRMYVYDVNGQYKPINFTDQSTGINWLGWKYVQADIPSTYQGPFKTFPNQMIRMMSLKSGTTGPMTKGEVYVDNVRVVYGASVDDMYNPIINDINVDGKTYNINEVSIGTTFSDDMSDIYATGMNYDRINMFVDGRDYTHTPGIYALNKGQNVVSISGFKLPDGLHRADVIVQDNFGNETKKSAYFTIDTNSGTTVSLDSPNKDGAPLGGVYKINLNTNSSADISEITAKIKIGKDYPINGVDFGAGAVGSVYDPVADYNKGILTLHIKNNSANAEAETLATINVGVPATMQPGQMLNYSVEYSDIKYNSDKGLNYGASFCEMPVSVPVTADYSVEIKDALVGREGAVLVNDVNGNPVEGAAVKVISGGITTDLGVTGADGIATGTVMTDTVKNIGVYAEKDGSISFTVNSQSLKPLLDKIPSNILATGVENSATSKNITWMSNPLTSEKAAIMQIALKSDYTANGEAAFANVNGKYKEKSFKGETDINLNGIVRFNSAVAKDLTAGAEYCYRVGDGINWSAVNEFKTTLENADTNFFVLGDTQTADTTNLSAILDAIGNSSIDFDFGMHVGDIVDDAGKFDQLNAVSSALGAYSLSSDADLITAQGNHEYMGDDNGDAAKTYYNTPLNGPESNPGACYSVDYGNVYIAVISFTADRDLLQKELDWLKNDAAKTDKTWKILLTHQPVYYSNPEGGNGLFKEMLPEVMDEIGMDFVFSGHDHAYGRTAQLVYGQKSPAGTAYIITGSTGQKYYSAVNDGSFEVFNDEQQPVYITANASKDTMTIKALRPDGTLVDTFTVQKTNSLKINVENRAAYTGEDVNVGVKFIGLNKLGGAKIKLSYDPQKLTYKDRKFDSSLQINLVDTIKAGEITFEVQNHDGITVQELMAATITFSVKSEIAEEITVPVSITSAEAYDSNKVNILTLTKDGSINIKPNPNPPADQGGTDTSNNGNGQTSTELDQENVEVIINGEKQENLANEKTSDQDGRKVTTVTLDYTKMSEALKQMGDSPVVKIPVNTGADAVIGELDWKTMQSFIDWKATLEIETENAGYTLPAVQLNIADILKKLEGNVKLEDIKLQINISKPDNADINVIENSAEKGRFSIVALPVEFSVKCISSNKVIDIDKFSTYVERTIAIPAGIDPIKVSSGIVVNADGSVRHVPTKIISIGGKHYAKINSMTNSTYALIQNTNKFDDLTKHWAENDVNDMGSRLVINGTGNNKFNPDSNITRAEFAAIVVKALGLKSSKNGDTFSDVNSSDWYAEYVKTASEYGLIMGSGNGKFNPQGMINREQAMAIISRAMDISWLKVELSENEADKLLESYSDAANQADWARTSMAECLKAEVINGRKGNLIAPEDKMTRAEAAVIVRRLLVKSGLI